MRRRLSFSAIGNSDSTKWEEARLKSRVESVLFGLGFGHHDLERDTAEFSGGWQMRIALAKLLLKVPSLLLLDEPTNHLDLPSLRWLEKFLTNYRGAIILVSHDRSFLDFLTRRTFSLSRGGLEIYAGNYTFFERESAAGKERLLSAYKSQQRKLAQTERFIERFRYKNTKARQVQNRIKALEKIDRIEIESDEEEIAFSFPPPKRSGRTVMSLESISKSYGSQSVFKEFSFEIERGDRLAVVGVNGAGKSTLSRILAGVEPVDSGERIVGYNVDIAYFGQDQTDLLHPDLTALETLEKVEGDGKRGNIRTILGGFLFQGDDAYKKVSVLSGGERNRLALARLFSHKQISSFSTSPQITSTCGQSRSSNELCNSTGVRCCSSPTIAPFSNPSRTKFWKSPRRDFDSSRLISRVLGRPRRKREKRIAN